MLFPGTQMHIITFLFISVETVILFYLFIYRLARPDDATTRLNITLITLLLIYNIAGGLLPDKNLPGSYFAQMVIAYAMGFITPCYFPYYVYEGFGLLKMRFHAFKGIFICLIKGLFADAISFLASKVYLSTYSIFDCPLQIQTSPTITSVSTILGSPALALTSNLYGPPALGV